MSDTVPSGAPDPRTDATTALDGSKPVQHGDQAGDTIGAYRLVSVLGEGGFGTVWLAERREPFVQRVALKVIKPGMDSRSVLGRFEQERQALAVMNHPNIARVLDGGMTPAGRPYFVMEYVKGQPITAFCDARRLSIRQRLELFVKVCEAIQHAHLKGIIHRDLKPSNILAFDAESQLPSVKVIDFGVAKAMQPATSAHTVFTETGQMIGTPEYMSPEQADPTSAEIDTRSDIYSLGVLLYELLTGVTPFDARELRSRAYREVQRYIAETDPPAPSTRLSTIGDADLRSRIVQARGQTAEGLMHSLRRELEWIPLMAMRKEPQNRYQSATDLARDVRNYLDGRALVAAPESTGYRIRKFVRRHRVGVATTAAVAAALIVGLGVSLWQWREAVAARALAESRAQEAEAVTRFVTDSLVRSDPMQGGDRELTVRQAMRQAMTQLEQRALADQPEVQARLQVAIADILFGNADLDEAMVLADRALATLERLHGPDAVEITPALSTLGRIHEQRAAYAQAEASHRRTLDIRRLRVPENEMAITRTMVNLSIALDMQGKKDEAESLLREVIDTRTRLLGPDDVSLAGPINNLAVIYKSRGRFAEAEKLYRRSLESRERVLGPDHQKTADSVNNLANVLGRLGKWAEAETLHRRALAIREKAFGADHPRTADSLGNLGIAIDAQGRLPEAEKHLRQALLILETRLGADHPDTIEMCRNLATNLRHQKRDAEAAPFEARVPAGTPTATPAQVP
jgi:serine/threonine protein kinase/Tfp pilus assembly protein PilF